MNSDAVDRGSFGDFEDWSFNLIVVAEVAARGEATRGGNWRDRLPPLSPGSSPSEAFSC